jgi:simple sugar transport system permease protein
VLRTSIFGGIVALLLGYLVWAPNGSNVSLSNILVAAVAATTPLLLGSSAGVLSERSGVINIAIEGQFLASACASAFVSSVTHSAVAGLFTGIGAGMLIGLLLSLLAIRYRVDQIVAGLILITLVTGVTGYVTEQFLDPNSTTLNTPATFSPLPIPGLDSIPIIGKALFDENILLYIAVAVVIGIEVMFARTALGLRIRASGENPTAALSSGVNVRRLRYGSGIVAGGLAGIGGTYFTLGSAGQFVAQMTAGLGYVSLAAVIFGGWRASRAAGAALLFGLATSIATSLGLLNVQVNPELLITAPYIVTIVVLAGTVGASKAPAADGVPLSEA